MENYPKIYSCYPFLSEALVSMNILVPDSVMGSKKNCMDDMIMEVFYFSSYSISKQRSRTFFLLCQFVMDACDYHYLKEKMYYLLNTLL